MKDNFKLNIDDLIRDAKNANFDELNREKNLEKLEVLFMLICTASYSGQYDPTKKPKKVLNKQLYFALQLILPLDYAGLLTEQELLYLVDCTFANEKFDRLCFNSLNY